MVAQLKVPDDYLILRRAVRDGVTGGLTPDATCRFHLALKQTVTRFLQKELGPLEEPGDTPGHPGDVANMIFEMQASFDEILVRLAQFTHEKRHEEIRSLERGQRKVLGFDQDRLQTLLDTMGEGFTSVDNLEDDHDLQP